MPTLIASSSASAFPYLATLASLGTLWTVYQLYSAAAFTWLHFLRPSGLSRYKKTASGKEPWALVTGASDGIGKGFVEELALSGFNIILHGRNAEKLAGIRDGFQSAFPERTFKLLILDAMADVKDDAKMRAAIEELKDLSIKVLVNNVGGNGNFAPLFVTLQDSSAAMVDAWIDVSARFPTQITRLLLPQLVKQQPALILNIGSGASEVGTPWLSVYSGVKSYNKAWSCSLQTEMLGEGHDVEVLAIMVGGVATERSGRTPSVTEPSPRTMAKSSLDVAGSGNKEVWAYWGHHLMFGLVRVLPTFVGEAFVLNMAKELKAKEEKGEKAL